MKKIDDSVLVLIKDMRLCARSWGERSNQYTPSEIQDEMTILTDRLEKMVKTGVAYDDLIREEIKNQKTA